MTYKLDEKQYAAAVNKDDSQRFEYFLRKVANFEKIWSLSDNEGWVELSDEDGQVCLPIWPHPDFAAAWATDEWKNCRPQAIQLDIWMERWTEGLIKDDTMLAIFPVDDGEGLILSPQELHDALLMELQGD